MHLPIVSPVQQDRQSYRTWLNQYRQRRAKLQRFNPPCYPALYGYCLWTGGIGGLIPYLAWLLSIIAGATSTSLLVISFGVWALSALTALGTYCVSRFRERQDLLLELPACYREAHKKAQKA